MTIAVLLLCAGPAAATGAEPPPDLAAMLADARRVQDADVAAWARHSFRRQAVKERLQNDQVVESEVLEFSVAPNGEAFDELLLRIDGRSPTSREIESHRRTARFSKRYARLRAGEPDDEEEGGYSLSFLLRMSSYRYAGHEEIDGLSSHRIEFAPGPPGTADGLAGRLAESMAGTVWLSVEGLHILRAEAHSLGPVPIALGLAKVTDLRLELSSVEAAGGAFLPSRILMRTNGHVLGRKFNRRYLYLYGQYAPATAGASSRP